MLSVTDLKDAVSTIRYKPDYHIFVTELDEYQGPYFVVNVEKTDSNNPNESVVLDIRSPIPPMRDYEDFYRWVGWRLKMIEIHEMMEFYRIDGKPYIDPHQL